MEQEEDKVIVAFVLCVSRYPDITIDHYMFVVIALLPQQIPLITLAYCSAMFTAEQ